jgi:hypothetical protein
MLCEDKCLASIGPLQSGDPAADKTGGKQPHSKLEHRPTEPQVVKQLRSHMRRQDAGGTKAKSNRGKHAASCC